MKKRVSSFASIYIIGMMMYILFLFYYIGTEIQSVNSSNRVIIAQQQELRELISLRDTRHTTKLTMLTSQYQDRIQKEREGILQPQEKEIILTKELEKYWSFQQSKEDEEKEYYLQQPIIEEWKDIFFPNNT